MIRSWKTSDSLHWKWRKKCGDIRLDRVLSKSLKGVIGVQLCGCRYLAELERRRKKMLNVLKPYINKISNTEKLDLANCIEAEVIRK